MSALRSFLFLLLQFNIALAGLTASQKCNSLRGLHLENTTILDVNHVLAGSNVTTPGSCQSSAVVSSAICRVQAVIATTSTSAVHFEAWLPDEWFGRFLGLGNGGLGGCIDYQNLDYGSTLHFASVGSDNGHDGGASDGTPFLNHPEVINDYAFRAVHVEAVIGKQIVEAYYKTSISKSYFLGCSTGGRQAMQSALKFPEDFDGLVGGSPATGMNHLVGSQVRLGQYIGAPNPDSSPSFIPAELWPVISQEILNQCDDLDGVEDGIITDPDQCNFRPESLLCTNPSSTNTSSCLTPPQVEALRKIYRPIFGTQGEMLYTKYDLRGESDGNFVDMFSGQISSIAVGWYQNVVFNDPNYSFENFNLSVFESTNAINPGDINTWDGYMETFRARGGKILTYHGRQDQLISSDNSLQFYNLVSSTLLSPNLDDFLRLFLIPGMGHCSGGPGAWAFGQSGIVSNVVNASTHNILLALVDWVENEKAPADIIGSVPGSTPNIERTHCRYPQRSVFDGSNFICDVVN
ncbi:hypothetical protein Clacol_009102 [Clathrus columnatus]|uniref:Carboxylic ester hydrolase n=1 Tax=Clathrus columnatus TaxID=1419009 RepID=A0AAV5AJM6_9AGAM|nr:hypothetical protein Clacol_009102 [Clathrus columnatus]